MGGFTRDESGLICKDDVVGKGRSPEDGDEIEFDYQGFNENGARIDSSYSSGRPVSIRLIPGSNLVPGLELAFRAMKEGGKRRVIIPPELGPPTGPSTFFSAKQWEVFDI